MNQKNESIDTDARLADFTDRLLDGETAPIASGSDDELLRLEQMVLRLTHAFPPEPQTDARAKQMLVRFKGRVRREENQAAKPSIWKRLFDFQSNPQTGLLLAAVVVLILAVVAIPSVQLPGSSATGAAAGGVSFYIAAGVLLVLLAAYWGTRKK